MSCSLHQKQTVLPSLGGVIPTPYSMDNKNTGLSFADYRTVQKPVFGNNEVLRNLLYQWAITRPTEQLWQELVTGNFVQNFSNLKREEYYSIKEVADVFLLFGQSIKKIAPQLVLTAEEVNQKALGLGLLAKMAHSPLEYLKELNQLWQQVTETAITANVLYTEILELIDNQCFDCIPLAEKTQFEQIYRTTWQLIQQHNYSLDALIYWSENQPAWRPDLIAPHLTADDLLVFLKKTERLTLFNELLLYLPPEEFKKMRGSQPAIETGMLWQVGDKYFKKVILKNSGVSVEAEENRWRSFLQLVEDWQQAGDIQQPIPAVAETLTPFLSENRSSKLSFTGTFLLQRFSESQRKELLAYYAQPANQKMCQVPLVECLLNTTEVTALTIPHFKELLKNCRQNYPAKSLAVKNYELNLAQKLFAQAETTLGDYFLRDYLQRTWLESSPDKETDGDPVFEQKIRDLRQNPPLLPNSAAVQNLLREEFSRFWDFAQKDFKPKNTKDKRVAKHTLIFWQLALAAQDETLLKEIWQKAEKAKFRHYHQRHHFWYPAATQKSDFNLAAFILNETEKKESHKKNNSVRNFFLNYSAKGQKLEFLTSPQKKEVSDLLWQYFEPNVDSGELILNALFNTQTPDQRTIKLAKKVLALPNGHTNWLVAQKQEKALDYLISQKKF